MSTPLGDFVRTRRDSTPPGSVGLPAGGRRRAPGLRRSELAALAGISVEYLVRIEQGHDRNPSVSVVSALADALQLDPTEQEHLRYLAKRPPAAASEVWRSCGSTSGPRSGRSSTSSSPESRC